MRILNDQYLQECINFKMKIGDKVCIFIFLFRSRSQTLDDFETFSKNYDVNSENIVQTQPAFTCSKLTIETLEQGLKYVSGVVLVPLWLTFNIFHTLF